MRHKALITALAALTLVGLTAPPASAITDGELDGDGHPYVGLMVAQDADGNPMWRCSGTLISDKVFLTAGHCTYGADRVEIWFESDLEPTPLEFGYPFTGDVSGTPHDHPLYDDAAFYAHDLGVVVLDEPMSMDEYGELPAVDQLDALATKRGQQDQTFTSVGYGLQKSFPLAADEKTVALRTRMVAYPTLTQINTGFTGDGSIHLSNNAHTGGTCSGDSGGPNFVGTSNVIAGVTSYGLNTTCAGTGGVYRVDRADDLDWLYAEFGALLP